MSGYHYNHNPRDAVRLAEERFRELLHGKQFPGNADDDMEGYEKHSASLESEGLRYVQFVAGERAGRAHRYIEPELEDPTQAFQEQWGMVEDLARTIYDNFERLPQLLWHLDRAIIHAQELEAKTENKLITWTMVEQAGGTYIHYFGRDEKEEQRKVEKRTFAIIKILREAPRIQEIVEKRGVHAGAKAISQWFRNRAERFPDEKVKKGDTVSFEYEGKRYSDYVESAGPKNVVVNFWPEGAEERIDLRLPREEVCKIVGRYKLLLTPEGTKRVKKSAREFAKLPRRDADD